MNDYNNDNMDNLNQIDILPQKTSPKRSKKQTVVGLVLCIIAIGGIVFGSYKISGWYRLYAVGSYTVSAIMLVTGCILIFKKKKE